jgi:hypothetical protein
MAFYYMDNISKRSGNPITYQGVPCINRNERQGNFVIDKPLTCQGVSCMNRNKRQGDSNFVIDRPLTCQGVSCINRNKRQGDSNFVIDKPLTRQANMSDVKRRVDVQHDIDTDRFHGSGTKVQYRDLCETAFIPIITYEQLLIIYEEPLITLYDKLPNTCEVIKLNEVSDLGIHDHGSQKNIFNACTYENAKNCERHLKLNNTNTYTISISLSSRNDYRHPNINRYRIRKYKLFKSNRSKVVSTSKCNIQRRILLIRVW